MDISDHCMVVLKFTEDQHLDLVFHSGSSTKEVYEEGLRDVALSVFSGINFCKLPVQ